MFSREGTEARRRNWGIKQVQARRHSFIESLSNIAIGYVVAVVSQVVIFPVFGIHVPISDNLTIGAWFTVVSVIRSYVIRRWFTKRTETALRM